ncbi:uncharacterized protein LOC116117011 [Pistacia vera]|uniref:uncharacterized protein LOC116117011 n=1 Tax=Pistacia vera TaxID=55513 RepID=UPI001263396F|nr:uncharacterized protein LOC116117011 [Pistacia vera]
MAREANTLFLEEWLRNSSASSSNVTSAHSSFSSSSSSSARAIIQAWTDLRDSIQNQRFQPHHLQALKALLKSQASLHVADPQAKLLLSILSSRNLDLPAESYPLLFKLLYIWIRKSFKPSLVLIDLAVEVLSNIFGTEFGAKKSPFFYADGLLLLGAFSFAPSVAEKSKIVCLELFCGLIKEDYQLANSFEEVISDLLAGIGYALSSSVKVHFVRILYSFFGIWGKEDGPCASVSHGLMILHLFEWVISGFIKSNYVEKIEVISQEIFENPKANYVPFALLMTAAGAIRACNRSVSSGQRLQILFKLRISAENKIESIAQYLTSKEGGFSSFLLQCLSLGLARSGSVSSRGPLFLCLASALLTEIFPLRQFYIRLLEYPHGSSGRLRSKEIKEHLESVLFKEAGAVASVLCNQYVIGDEENKGMVENLIWNYCQDIYLGHRQVSLLLRGREDELLGHLEKIAESAFLMVVVFALAVTKHKLNPKFSKEAQIETSVRILVSFSCVEYFRRVRLPEYMDTIRGVVVSVQENESACVSFVESMPSYTDLTNGPDFSILQKMEYLWSKDEVQTARILFYLRVIRTCMERVTALSFRRVIAPTIFLYMGHPNEKVAQASHSMFVGFISSGKDSNQDERVSLKEQLAFYYIQRSLAGYPGATPFKGMASGVAALARHLPAGCPATFYCIHSLVEKADRLCSEVSTHKADIWKNWQGESDPCKEILELLLRLISLVDIQVLPNLMKLLAQLIVKLPKDGQNLVLNELHSLVAESDDVTRKPTLVSWLQSLSYVCSQATSGGATSTGVGGEKTSLPAWAVDSLNARL